MAKLQPMRQSAFLKRSVICSTGFLMLRIKHQLQIIGCNLVDFEPIKLHAFAQMNKGDGAM